MAHREGGYLSRYEGVLSDLLHHNPTLYTHSHEVYTLSKNIQVMKLLWNRHDNDNWPNEFRPYEATSNLEPWPEIMCLHFRVHEAVPTIGTSRGFRRCYNCGDSLMIQEM